MRYFRRLFLDLPPLLRVVNIFGLLFPLAALALSLGVIIPILPSFPGSPADTTRVWVIVWNLVILGSACTFSVQIYRTRLRQPDRRPFPLSSWQSRMRAIAVVAALSICALVLAVVIPPTAGASLIVYPVSLLALGVLVALNVVGTGRQGGD